MRINPLRVAGVVFLSLISILEMGLVLNEFVNIIQSMAIDWLPFALRGEFNAKICG